MAPCSGAGNIILFYKPDVLARIITYLVKIVNSGYFITDDVIIHAVLLKGSTCDIPIKCLVNINVLRFEHIMTL